MSADGPRVFPPLYKRDVLACQFSAWYPLFKRHSPKATVLRPIPQEEELLEYLESDGLFLPEGSGPNGISELSDSDSDDDDDAASTISSEPPAKQFSFPHLDAEIRSVLSRYDGAVFPKLNWTSPQDAAWMIPGQNLKCQNPADVYLLLKSSDFISHDLDHAFDDCIDFDPSSTDARTSARGATGEASETTPPSLDSLSLGDSTQREAPASERRPYSFELVLKKWFDMPKSQEWRCFVRDRQLLGISQRDTTFYHFLQPDHVQQGLRDLITEFWRLNVRDQFPLSNYALDVYLTRDQSRTFIVDFNPFSPSTDSLLFDYSELASFLSRSTSRASSSPDDAAPHEVPPILRVVQTEMTGAMPRYSHNRYPKDVVELSDAQSVAEFAKAWGDKLAGATVDDDDDDDDDDGREAEEPVAPGSGQREETVGR
ncbi:hypothetical protein JCM10212_006881 [Sporobolomyces blumeae]